MKKSLMAFLVLTMIGSLPSRLAAQNDTLPTPKKRYQGLLWEITGANADRPSYLYGTMHVPEKVAFNLSDSFFIALRNCDVVALETDHDKWQEFGKLLAESPHYTDLKPDEQEDFRIYDLYRRIFQVGLIDPYSFQQILSYSPPIADDYLYRSIQERQDYEEDTYLDLFIYQAGKKLGKTVIGLETLETSYEMTSKARFADYESQDKSSGGSGYYTTIHDITEAYRKQDLSRLDSLQTVSRPGKRFRKWMLDERNFIMADGIDSIIRTGQTIMAAVGAAHLPADNGVIELLRRKGYSLRPVVFEMDSNKTEINEIMNLRVPVALSTQYVADSSWMVAAPGKFYAVGERNNWRKQEVCTDMYNGSWYAVLRLNTNGLWYGQTPDYIAKRIDSLVYEKVPGEILQRKRLYAPYPGHEIETRTRRGDVRRFKLFVTPFELVLFIAGGNRDYIQGPEGKKFFDSIRLIGSSEPPVETRIVRPQHGFEITFPQAPAIDNSLNAKTSKIWMASALPQPDGYDLYFLMRGGHHDAIFIEQDSFELNMIGEIAAKTWTNAAPQTRYIAESPFAIQDFQAQNADDGAWLFGRIVIDGPRYYLLGCRKKSPEPPNAFFESFQITGSVANENWTTKTDTLNYFTVDVVQPENQTVPDFIRRLHQAYVENEAGNKKKNIAGGLTTYESDYFEQFVNRPGSEVVTLNVRKAFNWVGIDSLQRAFRYSYHKLDRLWIKSENWRNEGDTLVVADLLLTDSATSRGIRKRIYFTAKRQYELNATLNISNPDPSLFIERIFDSFRPAQCADSLKLVKTQLPHLEFLAKIYDADSLTRSDARKELKNFWPPDVTESDYEWIRQTFETKSRYNLSNEHRQHLLLMMALTNSPHALPYLLKVYHQNPDSIRLRAAVINAISEIKREEAFDAVFRLWSPDLFYGSYLYSAIPVAISMRDSSRLGAKYLDRLLMLASRQDMQTSALELIESLKFRKAVRPRDYRRIKPILMTNLEWSNSRARLHLEERRDQNNTNDNTTYSWNTGQYVSPFGDDEATAKYPNRELKLLLPWYKSDKKVRQLIDDTYNRVPSAQKLEILMAMIENNIAVPPYRLKSFTQDEKTLFLLYEKFGDRHMLRPYAGWFTDTLAMMRSYVLDQMRNENIDSIRFYARGKSRVYSAQVGQAWYFEVKIKDVPEWMLVSVTYSGAWGFDLKAEEDYHKKKALPTKGSIFLYQVRNTGVFQRHEDAKTEEEKIKLLKDRHAELRFVGRMRYRA